MDEILNYHQYALKLSLKYFFYSGTNIILFIICYLVFGFSDFLNFMIFYLGGVILAYKFIFSYNRGSNPYSIYVLKVLSSFFRRVRKFKFELKNQKRL